MAKLEQTQWAVGGREGQGALGSDELVFIYDARGHYVAQWVPVAHAPLIAAAPALYEALEAIAPWLRNGDYDTRGGLIEMDRLASVAESALATARQGE